MHTLAPPLPDRRIHALRVWALTLLLLWLFAAFAGPSLLAASGLTLNVHGHAHLYAHGHPFVDARMFWGIPNTLDVLSNVPLSLAGLWGLLVLRGRVLPVAIRSAARVFFAGLLLTGFGSAWYHWAPDAAGLVWDRLGMAVTFAGALALAVAERVGSPRAPAILWTTLLLALVSALLPLSHDNALPWAVLQVGGVALVVWCATRSPADGAIGIRIGALIGWYLLAKVMEMGDAAVFQVMDGIVSGHSLKHIAASLAAAPVLAAVLRQPLRQNAAGAGAPRTR